ncbi:hypothetical protein [Stackebrandtia nassauensis]|uniref:WD40 repeat protein n=1 Tax=Stackebrandtia nassauensis (strain DSM 44728 / CIP 108903 / NRRL B-16338 / NBRC 102104 / LLR-40K-21) TaxID=446470 RepID=D3QBM7_STANL|nr:hypothetical protein [Stackebrandtia nassauensis]ADD42909.1 hypothetical protein Snas_3239 [Stackebrandtia nassauensis DSM 44728]
MHDHLTTDMKALADRARTVDLTERTHATARRLRTTRIAVAGVAALALAVGTGAVWTTTALPQGGNGVPPAASTDRLTTKLDGRFVFTRGSEVVTWTPGGDPEVLDGIEDPNPETFRFSPDGVLLSYLDQDGQLHVHDVADDAEIRVPDRDIVDASADPPVWTPDSQRLWIDTGREEDRYGFYDVDSGEFTPSQEPAGRDTVVVRSPDGDGEMLISLREASDGNELVSVTPDGDEQVLAESPVQGTGEYITDILSTDVDGSRMCLDTSTDQTTNPAKHPTCRTLLAYDDKAAANVAPVATPLLGWIDGDESADATSAALIAGSGQRVQQFDDRATLVTGVDEVVDEAPLPDELTDGDPELVAYQP